MERRDKDRIGGEGVEVAVDERDVDERVDRPHVQVEVMAEDER